MSWVMSEMGMLSAASGNLAVVGSTMDAQNAVAAVSTDGAVPPAADLVSNLVVAQFLLQSHRYQALAAMAKQIHGQIVSNLQSSASAYTTAEAHNAAIAH